MAAEKVLCEFRRPDEFEMRCLETDDGFRIEIKGDKEKIRRRGLACSCLPAGQAAFSCCPPAGAGGSKCC